MVLQVIHIIQEFELDSDDVIGYVSSAGEYVFMYTNSYGDETYFMLDDNYAELCDLSGTYQIAGDGGESSIDITITAYTYDNDEYERECELFHIWRIKWCIILFG